MFRNILIPISIKKEDILQFCYFMEYEIKGSDDDFIYFNIPNNHVCQLYINADKLKKGQFNKELFLKERPISC